MPTALKGRACATVLGVVGALACATACVPPVYQMPKPNEPHAIVKIRRVYHGAAGVWLSDGVWIQDHVADQRTVTAQETATHTRALRVHPRPAHWRVGSTFFHTETRLVSTPYTVQTPYTSVESYSCGGYNSGFRMCSRTVTHYRSETRYRLVPTTVNVTDSACGQSFGFHPQTGALYLLQFTFFDTGVCQIACLRQTSGPNGAIADAPCSSAEYGVAPAR